MNILLWKIKLLYLKIRYGKKLKEVIFQRILSNADRTVDALERAWISRPKDMPIKEQQQLIELLEKAKEMRVKLQQTLREAYKIDIGM